MSPPLRYTEFAPDARLDRHALSYWAFHVEPDAPPDLVHHIWPDGCVSVACVRGAPGGTVLLGPRVDPLRLPVRPGATYWGVRFWPDAGAAVLGLDAARLRDAVGLAEPWIAERARALGAALSQAGDQAEAAHTLDLWLGPLVTDAPPLSRPVRAAVSALAASHGEQRIADVARAAGISLRHLERRFGAAVGLRPKEYARIRRLRSAMARLIAAERPRWTDLAADHGYADQAHLVREFGRLTGLTPEAVADHLAGIRHGTVTP